MQNMDAILLGEEIICKLEKFRKENESLDEVLSRIIETYEAVEEYINEKWEKLREDKDKFIDLEDYSSSRGL